MDKKNGKIVVTTLLALSCVISSVILAASPSHKSFNLDTAAQLDSLLNVHIHNSLITPQQVRVSSIQVDTSLTRKEYRLRVPSRFSKTMFHIGLHDDLNRFDIETPAKILFPSRDMHIYVYYKGTVLRTIRLTTDTDLDTLKINSIETQLDQ
ncbi:hypothetical protein [Gracilimonas halophila]|uniref:Uncharacterized protein n=1 Tax=Gracilimonas halophila TaxID=1834464 RepID=A0ABW5JMU4_9BACT